jgi:hypothetical protein
MPESVSRLTGLGLPLLGAERSIYLARHDRMRDAGPAVAGHPHAPTTHAAGQLAAASMFLDECVEGVSSPGTGREPTTSGKSRPGLLSATGLPRHLSHHNGRAPAHAIDLGKVLPSPPA